MGYVNIVTSDRGWILERLAREIESRLPYVRFSGKIDPEADIQYYMTYSCRFARISPVEIGYFAHLEPDGEARDKFFNVAQDVDYCITHSELYAAMLRDFGLNNVEAISPGVDLERFNVRLRVGVVGRTYHTGRKGEHLVSQLLDIPEIDWKFTGDGWPGPGLHVPEEDLADFYRNLDYVLVPALYEGGPMCVVEALACGTEVIAPPVGWVPEFPHFEYPIGDVAALRQVLLQKIEEKKKLRATVLNRTWDDWAAGHDAVFRRLAAEHDIVLAPPPPVTVRDPDRIGLLMHGSEGRSPGGPSVRVPRLARELNQIGFQAQVKRFPGTDLSQYDIVHAFNVWAPDSALDLIRRGKQAGRKVVFSPIFLDLSQRPLWEDELPKIFETAETPEALETALDRFEYRFQKSRQSFEMSSEAEPGFYPAVREMVALSDHVIYLSERERDRLERIGARPKASTVVHNPVDFELFGNIDPNLFEAEFGIKDFVVCVARQETRKNQLMLLQALKGTDIPIVLIGHIASKNYRALLERYAGPNVTFIERLPPNTPLLAAAFAAARVSVLPSWAEGAPLAALEAAAAGASMVLSDESGESEYFGDLARYADPASVSSLRQAVLEAYETRRTPDEVAAQKQVVAENYSWKRHIDATREVYRQTYQAANGEFKADADVALLAIETVQKPVSVVYDVTTSANHKGRWTGIARVETALAIALREHPNVASIQFVAWNNKAQTFFEVPFDAIMSGKTSTLLSFYDSVTPAPLSLPANAHYIVPGSGWMQNARYAEGLVAFKNRYRLRLTPIIHDVIPVRFPFWFNDGYAPVFMQNLSMLLGNAEHILSISQWTKKDIEHFGSISTNLHLPKINVFREGDEIGMIAQPKQAAEIDERLHNKNFVLCVGAIHLRKNHKLLYDVWLKLAERMGGRCPKLVIVGGVAWNGEELARALRGDARIKDHILILDHIDDNALAWLYENCLFTVYPSLYEGWGLPVSESLRYGKLCIASNASSVPEIAPEFIELLDPLDPEAWLVKIRFYAGNRLAREERERKILAYYKAFSWKESADELTATLIRAESLPFVERPYTPGRIVHLSNSVGSAPYKQEGWFLAEKWGSWTAQSTAALEFMVREPFTGPAVLVAKVQSLLFSDTVSETRVTVNGVPTARWMIDKSGLQVRAAVIPEANLRSVNTIRVEFHNDTLVPIAHVTKGKDRRSVGIGVGLIALAPVESVRDAQSYIDPVGANPHQICLGVDYNFLKQDKIRACLQGEWSQNTAWGVFNMDRRPRLSFSIHEALADDLHIEVTLRSVATATNPINLIALVNDIQCGAWVFQNDQVQTIRLLVPQAIRHRSDPLFVDLVSSDTQAPKSLGLGGLEQEFGFGLFSIRINSAAARRPASLLPVTFEKPLVFTNTLKELIDVLDLKNSWHGLEKNGIWSNGARARLNIPVPPNFAGDLLLWLGVGSFGREQHQVPVQVCVNGFALPDISLDGQKSDRVGIIIPASVIAGRDEMEVELTMAEAGSPYKATGGADERLLGFRLRSLALKVAPVLRPNMVAFFGSPRGEKKSINDAALYVCGNWYNTERDGRWTRGQEGRISVLPSPGSQSGRLFLLTRVVGAAPESMVTVDVQLNGANVESWDFTSDKVYLVELTDFSKVKAEIGGWDFSLVPRNPQTPKELQLGNDNRLLGVFVRAMVLADDAEAAVELFRSKGLKYDEILPRHDIAATAGAGGAQDEPISGEEESDHVILPSLSNYCRIISISSDISIDDLVPQAGTLMFSEQSETLNLLDAGWYGAEPEGVWSHEEGGSFYLPLDQASDQKIRLTLLLRVYGSAVTGAANVVVSAYGVTLAHVELMHDKHYEITLELDLTVFNGMEPLITLVRERSISPAQGGESDDTRIIGVFLSAVKVHANLGVEVAAE